MIRIPWIKLVLLSILTSCSAYKHNILFKTDSSIYPAGVEQEKILAEKNYKIRVNDKLKIRVYTNEGERIIDPDYELSEKLINQNLVREEQEYLVQSDGMVKIPMIGLIHLQDFTIMEAEEILEESFGKFYKNPFVRIQYTNKRVIVLGASGGQVIPIMNEDINLIEILALAGGINKEGNGENIRLIRGDLKNPEVRLIDLSTIEGMKNADLKVLSGDIIYIEPVRKVASETIADIAPLISLFVSFATLLILIRTL